MRDSIARALARVLALFIPWTRRPEPGRHSAAHFVARAESAAVATPASPWRRPWLGPSSADARAIFGAVEARTLDPVRRERFFATAWAERGVDYEYIAPGIHQVRPGAVRVA